MHIDGTGPTALILSRQKLPVLANSADRAPAGVPKGAYTLVDEPAHDLDVVLVGTGSEVSVCVEAAALLATEGIGARVVSMPSWDLFATQDDDYRSSVLPAGIPKLSVEAGVTFGWERWVDTSIGIDHFGASAPGSTVLAEFGFTAENVADHARSLIAGVHR